MPFFYPVHNIRFVHPQNLSHSTATNPAIVHFDCQFTGLFRVFMPLRVYRVIYAALLTLAALASRRIIPCPDLAFCFSTFWASFPYLYCLLSHSSYYIIISLFWTLLPPAGGGFFPGGSVPGLRAVFSPGPPRCGTGACPWPPGRPCRYTPPPAPAPPAAARQWSKGRPAPPSAPPPAAP